MQYNRLNLAQKLVAAREMIQIALKENDLLVAMSEFGFNEERLRKGLVLLEEAETLDHSQQRQRGEQIAASADVKERFKDLLSSFRLDRRIVSNASRKHKGLTEQLQLKESVNAQRDALLQRSLLFYRHLLAEPKILGKLEPYGFTEESVQEKLGEIKLLQDAMIKQQERRAQAIITTDRRKKAQALLDDYIAQFIAIARVAFRHDKGQLKKFGL